MRIIGGTLRGLKLAEIGAGDPAAHLRPTTDRVREAVFNLLMNRPDGNPVAGARVLDLFAGTGAMGLEAVSRGAAHATFVDDGAAARALIAQNIARTRSASATALIRRDATRLGAMKGAPFTLVFLDPPYGLGLGEAAIGAALEGGWIAPGATILWEDNRPPAWPAPLTLRDQRRYGDSWITLLTAPV